MHPLAVLTVTVFCVVAFGLLLRRYGNGDRRRHEAMIESLTMALPVLESRLKKMSVIDGTDKAFAAFIESCLPLARTALDFENFPRCRALIDLCWIGLDWSQLRYDNHALDPAGVLSKKLLEPMMLVKCAKFKLADHDLRALWLSDSTDEEQRAYALRIHIASHRAQGWNRLADEQLGLLFSLPAMMKSGLVTGFSITD